MSWNPITGAWVADESKVKEALDHAYSIAAAAAEVEEAAKLSALDKVKAALHAQTVAAKDSNVDTDASAMLVDSVAAEAAATAVAASTFPSAMVAASSLGTDFTVHAAQAAVASALGRKRPRELDGSGDRDDDEAMSMATKRRMRRGKAHGVDLKEAVALWEKGFISKAEYKELKMRILKTDPNPPRNAKVVQGLVAQVKNLRTELTELKRRLFPNEVTKDVDLSGLDATLAEAELEAGLEGSPAEKGSSEDTTNA